MSALILIAGLGYWSVSETHKESVKRSSWMDEHPDERAQIAQRGRDMCERMFSTDAMIEALERVYFGDGDEKNETP